MEILTLEDAAKIIGAIQDGHTDPEAICAMSGVLDMKKVFQTLMNLYDSGLVDINIKMS